MHELRERIALVESRVKHIDATLAQLGPDVRQIRDSLHKQRGFISGFAAAFTLLWSAVAGLAYWLFTILKVRL